MGIYVKGLLGAFSGKVGNVVGSSWRSVDYLRSLGDAPLIRKIILAILSGDVLRTVDMTAAPIDLDVPAVRPCRQSPSFPLSPSLGGSLP